MIDLTFGAGAEARYGAPYLLMHRGDLHAALFSVVPQDLISFDKKLVGLDQSGACFKLRFADGSSGIADVRPECSDLFARVVAKELSANAAAKKVGDQKAVKCGRAVQRFNW
jgi:hypothetical protein